MYMRVLWGTVVAVGLCISGCAAERVPYDCAAWCAADASDVVYRTYSAVDESDAQQQCFDNFNCSDMPGRILRCMCEVGD